jgi:D-alanyl-lipoteichoic acid acyltransferase DltB (MBOAT superfamily)
MLFNSTAFVLGFLPLVYAGFLFVARFGSTLAPRLWLLTASFFFYAWWNPPFVLLLAASILANYGFGLKLRASGVRRRWLVAGLVFNLGVLAFFKYGNFLAALCGFSLPAGDIFLPLGISFFTFQQVMFLVDTYRGEIAVDSFLNYACFVAFFPHLIAGPIVRPRNIIPQFAWLAPLQGWRGRLADGMEIFLLGLAKKLVMADGLARFADPGFAAAARHDPISFIEAWVALLAYGLQIYFDFSGYSGIM